MGSAASRPAVGVVLAGGAATRMGEDKALLTLGGESLLARAGRLLRGVVPEVAVADGGTGRPAGDLPAVPDGPGRGPVAGILGAAGAYPGRALLVLACDLPLVPAGLLERLALSAEPDWAVPRWNGRLEPLCALYGPAALAALARQVARGRFALHELAGADAVAARYVEGDELALFGRPEEMFLNVNTPGDWQRYRQLIR